MGDPTCKNCGTGLVWKKPYVQGEPPVNPDGTKHTCDAPAAAPTGKPRVEIPIEQIVAEISVIQGTMATSGKDNEGKEIGKHLVYTEAMIEGIWKYAISRKMSR